MAAYEPDHNQARQAQKRMLIKSCLGLLLSLLVATPLLAQMVSPKKLESLAYSKEWLRLIHYQDTWGGYKSLVDKGPFFLSPEGRTSPLAELKASLEALTSHQRLESPSLAVHCAFPARSRFLARRLGVTPSSEPCPDFEHWRKNLDISEVRLVFSTAFASNPASMFGHTFIRLVNSQGSDYAVSFLAIPDDSMSYIYMFKGLTGQYPGVFTLDPYYQKVTEYTQLENRDLWEYPLDFSNSQIELLLAHLWELYSTAIIDYYFLDDNCSYVLLSLLESVDPKLDLTQLASNIVTPHETVAIAVEEMKLDASPVTVSLRKVFRERYQALSYKQKIRLHQIIQGVRSVDDEDSTAVIDAAIDYYTLRKGDIRARETTDQAVSDNLDSLLLKRASMQTDQMTPVVSSYNRPDWAHKGGKASLGLGFDQRGPRPSVMIRYGLHSLVDSSLGYEPGLAIEYLKVEAERDDERWRIREFNLCEIYSLSAFNPLDPQMSWAFRLGADSESALLKGGIGLSMRTQADLFLSLLPSLTVRPPRAEGKTPLRAIPSLHAFLVLPQIGHFKGLAEIEQNRESSNWRLTQAYNRRTWQASISVSSSTTHPVKTQVALGLYF